MPPAKVAFYVVWWRVVLVQKAVACWERQYERWLEASLDYAQKSGVPVMADPVGQPSEQTQYLVGASVMPADWPDVCAKIPPWRRGQFFAAGGA